MILPCSDVLLYPELGLTMSLQLAEMNAQVLPSVDGVASVGLVEVHWQAGRLLPLPRVGKSACVKIYESAKWRHG